MECLEDRTVPAIDLLDPAFGARGIVLTDFVRFTPNPGQALAQQADGRLIVVGSVLGDFAVARYLPNGFLDSTFGNSGKVTTHFAAEDSAFGVAVQPDGRIVVVGGTDPLFSDFAIARYHADGRLDTSFGSGGRVVTDFSASDIARGVVIQPDRKIVVVGTSSSAFTTSDVVLARYLEDGRLDPSFGLAGRVFTNVGSLDTGHAILLDLEDRRLRFVVVGSTDLLGSTDFLVLRYLDNGVLDPNFGQGGRAVTDFGLRFARGLDIAYGVLLQPDDKILVAGGSGPGAGFAALESDFALARYTPSGLLDTTFGLDGLVLTDFGGTDIALDLVLRADLSIIVAGTGGPQRDFALACYDALGRLDPRSGVNGLVLTNLGGDDVAYGVELQRDGTIVAAGKGSANPVDPSDFALAGYLSLPIFGDQLPPGTPIIDGVLHARFVNQLFLDLLGRPADSAGLAAWTGLLNGGTARAQVVSGILASNEYLTLTVNGLYQQYLRRDADPAGLQSWVAVLGQGATPEQVAAALMGSSEYWQNRAGGTIAGFLDAAYLDVLNRPIDPNAQARFTHLMSLVTTPGQVAAVLFGSVEYRQRLVASWYESYLRRAADPDGLAGYVEAIRQGSKRQEALAQVLASEEYLDQLR